MQNNVKIGMFGYGCVGQGLHDVLLNSRGFRSDIKRICIKDPSKPRRIKQHHFTIDRSDILDDPEINLVVELINDADEAYKIVKTALQNGKNVVTANKRMLAHHLPELIALQEKHKVSLLYEAACCGCIPIIRNLEEYYDNELLFSVSGIFNGSSNYILSNMYNEGLEYHTALKQAQELGFAETDPSLDVDGIDARNKLAIITGHAYGLFLNPDEFFHSGISKVSVHDLQYAREKGYKLKLVPSVYKVDDQTITFDVMPRYIKPGDFLYNVEDEYNGVVAEAAFSNRQFFYGKGAGGHPTGSAVLSDISANSYGYRYEYKKHFQHRETSFTRNVFCEIYARYQRKEDLEILGLAEVSESYKGKEFNYIVGRVNMETHYKHRREIENSGLFIARAAGV